MIVTEVFYGVKCNRCGCLYEDGDDHTFFADKSDAIEGASDNDWMTIDNKDYCPNCYQVDEGAYATPKPPYPSYVKTVESFLCKIAKLPSSVSEENGAYIVRGYTAGRTKTLGKADAEWITNYLKENLVCIGYEDINASNARFFIVIK